MPITEQVNTQHKSRYIFTSIYNESILISNSLISVTFEFHTPLLLNVLVCKVGRNKPRSKIYFKRLGSSFTMRVYIYKKKKWSKSSTLQQLQETSWSRKITENQIENVQQQCLVNTSVQSTDMTAKTDRREDAFDSQCAQIIPWVRWQQQVTN